MESGNIVFHPKASEEYIEALDWYTRYGEHLGQGFEHEVDRALRLIANSPERWPQYGPHHRRILVHRFPYVLVYLLQEDQIMNCGRCAWASQAWVLAKSKGAYLTTFDEAYRKTTGYRLSRDHHERSPTPSLPNGEKPVRIESPPSFPPPGSPDQRIQYTGKISLAPLPVSASSKAAKQESTPQPARTASAGSISSAILPGVAAKARRCL